MEYNYAQRRVLFANATLNSGDQAEREAELAWRQGLLSEISCPPEPEKHTLHANRILIVTGLNDYYVPEEQANAFHEELHVSTLGDMWMKSNIVRVRDVGAGGHGMGLIRSRDFVALLRAEAATIAARRL